jgi:hypothetical protein
LNIPYAIGGSLASSVYGEIRSTYDVDISVHLNPSHIKPFVAAFEKLEWYIFAEGIQRAITDGSSFQVIDGSLGLKADFFALSSPPTSRQQRTLDRVRRLRYGDGDQSAYFMSPEDVILYKLEWYQLGKSEKHLRDISAMLSVSGDQIDPAYITHHASEIQSNDLWTQLYTTYRHNQDDP